MNTAKWSRCFFWLGLLLTVSAGYFNQGIIALDDYSEGIARFIPAQTSSFRSIIETTGIRLPFQALFLLTLSKFSLWAGISSPTHQLQFVLVIIAFIVFSIQSYCATRFFEDSKKALIVQFFISFYFFFPLIFSRPLIENLAGAFVTLSAFCSYRYWREGRNRWITLGMLAIASASIFRFQAGVCVIGLFLLPLLKKDRQGLIAFFLAAVLAFFLTGLLDFALTGGFHRSLYQYVDYNLRFSSSYGTTPFYTFLLLLFALSLPPAFLGLYQEFEWTKIYRPLVPVVLYFTTFLISHSAIPHKEERFMVPILVLFFVLLTPLASYFLQRPKQRWRAFYFCFLNFLLLPWTSFSAPQSNVIGIVQHLNQHSEITTLYDLSNSMVLVPEAFAVNKFETRKITDAQSFKTSNSQCNSLLAVRKDVLDSLPELKSQFTLVLESSPGPLEQILVKLNPHKNGRRGSIFLFSTPDCERKTS